MIPIAKVYEFVPGLDEALLVSDYAEMFGESEKDVLMNISRRTILGVQHNGEWYVEAPPFYLDALNRINRQRLESARGKQQGYSRSHKYQNDETETEGRRKDLNYYGRVLGLNGQVTFNDIRRRYRELVAQYHPDKVSHLGPKLKEVAEKEMKEINEAYQFFKQRYQGNESQPESRR